MNFILFGMYVFLVIIAWGIWRIGDKLQGIFTGAKNSVEWSKEDDKKMDAVIKLLENTSAIHPNFSHRNLIIWLNDIRKKLNQDKPLNV